VLLATDADWLFDDVDAGLGGPDMTLSRIRVGADVLATTAELEPDLVILDLQIGNMGGMATSLAIKEDLGHKGLSDTPVMILLDRTDDTFLARRSDADGWLVKPVDPVRLRRAANELMAGRPYREGWDAEEVTEPEITGPAG
jgi:DNA-binding response OmpR family regulator